MGETFCGTPTEQSRTQLYLVTEEVSHLPLSPLVITRVLAQLAPAHRNNFTIFTLHGCTVTAVSGLVLYGGISYLRSTPPDTNTNHTLYIFTVFFTASNPYNCSKCAIH